MMYFCHAFRLLLVAISAFKLLQFIKMQHCAAAFNGVAQAETVTYSFATAGYTPVGLNFISRRAAPTQAGVRPLTV